MSIRVVLVDDMPDVRRLVRTALRFRGSFEVVGEAATGADAIEIISTLRPDIVVLDIGLPDLAGQEVLTQIRDVTPETKVVVFSGTEPRDSGGIDQRVEGYALKDSQLDYLVDLLEAISSQRVGQAEMGLDGSLTSARDARQFAKRILSQWDAAELADDVLLVITELVNNAVTHARSDCQLRISITDQSLRIEVSDRGAGTPDPLPQSATRNHGRGLHLVDALTAAWGYEPLDSGGKLVWAELLRTS